MRVLVAVVLALVAAAGYAEGWTLVWADEFNGPAVDRSRWRFETGAGGWGNHELQAYTDGANASIVDDGPQRVLRIEARQEDSSEDGEPASYTSARLVTRGLQSFTYGRIEARIRLPEGRGFWPAFWLLGDRSNPDGSLDYPECGEIDVLELVGGAPTGAYPQNDDGVIWSSVHRPNRSEPGPDGEAVRSVTEAFRNPGGHRFSEGYHVFGLEWDPRFLRFSVDGRPFAQWSIADRTDGWEVFHRPFFLVLNLAVGGDWPGPPDQSSRFPQAMDVDWVRVYQRS